MFASEQYLSSTQSHDKRNFAPMRLTSIRNRLVGLDSIHYSIYIYIYVKVARNTEFICLRKDTLDSFTHSSLIHHRYRRAL